MGGARFDSVAYASTAASYTNQTREQIFSSVGMPEKFDPKRITVRESCDSEQNPESTPVILALDVTGSMGFIPEALIRQQIGDLIEGIYADKPITDPHIMAMAIGDIRSDNAPLQVTQFEADIRIVEQLQELWLEGRGGGNDTESYDLPWAFAALKTKIDSFDKRGKKGYLFTFGDEMPPGAASARSMADRVGLQFQQDPTAEDILSLAKEQWHVFHLIAEEGSYYRRRDGNRVYKAWTELMGNNAMLLNDHRNISEVVQAVIKVSEGADPQEVIDAQQGDAVKASVERALFGPGQ